MTIDNRTPRARIALEVLERARDCQDNLVIAAAIRVLNADRLGWRKHGRKEDLQLVYAFDQAA
jgi:hypothetical protein